MTRRLTALAAWLVLGALVVAGCGDKEPGVPRSDARELIALLKSAQSESDDPQKCEELAATIRDIQSKVESLPAKTDRDVRDSLENGVKNLAESARSQCEETTTTETTPDTTTIPTTPPPSTETTPPETTPPETTPPETTPPETTPPTTTPPPPPTTGGTGPGNGNGNGNGNGLGNGKVRGHERFGHGHDNGRGHDEGDD